MMNMTIMIRLGGDPCQHQRQRTRANNANSGVGSIRLLLFFWFGCIFLLLFNDAVVNGIEVARDSGTAYDLSKNMFSPTGKLMQIEYAKKAVAKGPLCVGARCKDGIVLAFQVDLDLDFAIILDQESNKNIYRIEDNIAILVAGAPGGVELVQQAMSEATSYKRLTGESVPGAALAQR
ncbi:unnamed protein product, partial [Heterosigma akashiwo]